MFVRYRTPVTPFQGSLTFHLVLTPWPRPCGGARPERPIKARPAWRVGIVEGPVSLRRAPAKGRRASQTKEGPGQGRWCRLAHGERVCDTPLSSLAHLGRRFLRSSSGAPRPLLPRAEGVRRPVSAGSRGGRGPGRGRAGGASGPLRSPAATVWARVGAALAQAVGIDKV